MIWIYDLHLFLDYEELLKLYDEESDGIDSETDSEIAVEMF